MTKYLIVIIAFGLSACDFTMPEEDFVIDAFSGSFRTPENTPGYYWELNSSFNRIDGSTIYFDATLIERKTFLNGPLVSTMSCTHSPDTFSFLICWKLDEQGRQFSKLVFQMHEEGVSWVTGRAVLTLFTRQ